MLKVKQNTNIFLNFFVFIYITTINMTDTFSYNEKIPIYMFASIFILIMFSKKKIDLSIYGVEDFFLISFICWILFVSLFNLNEKSLNYTMTYVYILGILYLFLKGFLYKNIKTEFMLRMNYYGTFFLVFFLIFEFIGKVFFDFDIQDILPRRREASATFLGLFNRSYGFSTEPGVVAYYLSSLGLVSIWYVYYRANINLIKKIFLLSSFILAEAVVYSATGIGAIIISSVIVSIILFKKKDLYKLLIILLIIVGILIRYGETVYMYTSPIIEKVQLSSSTASGEDRSGRWTNALSQVQEHPLIGIGLGGLSANAKPSPVSWYLFIMVETGIVSILLLFSFYFFIFKNLYFSKIAGIKILMISFIASIIHLAVISSFHYPFIFLNIIIISFLLKEEKNNLLKASL